MPAPAAGIVSVRVDGVEQPSATAIVVPPGSRDLEIRYTAPSFVRPEQLQFRYRLRGHDDAWIDTGTRRVASFANLAPGRYEFEVTARSHAGAWSEHGRSVHLELQPYLHQRLAFKVAVIVALVVAVAAGVPPPPAAGGDGARRRSKWWWRNARANCPRSGKA